MVTEARRVMHDVAQRDRQHAGRVVAVGVEADERRHEPAGLRELECGGGERRAARRGVDVERRAVDGRDADDAGDRAQAVEIGRRGKRHGDGAAQLVRQARRMRALGGHEHDGAAAARGDEPREQRCLHRFDGRDEESARTVGDLHGTATAQLVDGAVERQRSGITVDFLVDWGGHRKKRVVSRGVRIPAHTPSFRAPRIPFNATTARDPENGRFRRCSKAVPGGRCWQPRRGLRSR